MVGLRRHHLWSLGVTRSGASDRANGGTGQANGVVATANCLVARLDRPQHRGSPRDARRRRCQCRIHPSRAAHRSGRPRDSGGNRGLQPPRHWELCNGGSLPVGLCNNDRGRRRLPSPIGRLSRRHRIGTVTDSDPATSPDFTPGAPPSGVDAARAGGELLVSAATSPNVGGTDSEGPWLKEPPDGNGYSIWVANDGTGMVQVLDAAGHVPAGATHTAKDCTAILAGSAPTTTTTAAPTTTTTTAPPTTTTAPTTTSPTTTSTTTPHNGAPRFTSEHTTTFRHGVFGSFTVTVSGSPRPSLRVSGSLPSGVGFNRASGVLSGTPRKVGFQPIRPSRRATAFGRTRSNRSR